MWTFTAREEEASGVQNKPTNMVLLFPQFRIHRSTCRWQGYVTAWQTKFYFSKTYHLVGFFLNVKLKTSYCLNVIMFITNEDVAVRDSRRRGTNMLMHSCIGSERKVTVSNPWPNPTSYLWGGAEKRKLSRLCRNLPYRHNQTATQGSQLVTARCEPTVGSSRWRDGLPWVCAPWPATVPCGEEWLPWSPV